MISKRVKIAGYLISRVPDLNSKNALMMADDILNIINEADSHV
jgi:hypothetical protein